MPNLWSHSCCASADRYFERVGTNDGTNENCEGISGYNGEVRKV